jgi:uncharacterized phiE125 gp8 family phage protein
MARLTLVTPAAVPPVETDDLRDYLKVDEAEENDIVLMLRDAAVEYAQTWTNHQFINATYDWFLDQFWSELRVPIAPLSSVTSLKYIDTAGDEQTLVEDTDYTVDTDSVPGVITPVYGTNWPSTRVQRNAVTMRFIAGYGTAASDVPARFKHAVKMHVALLYEQREAAAASREVGIIRVVPMGWQALLHQDRLFNSILGQE